MFGTARLRVRDLALRVTVAMSSFVFALLGVAHADSLEDRLPAFRWLGSTMSLHSRVDWTNAQELMGSISRATVQSWMLGISQAIWGGTIGLLKFALTDFNPTDAASGAIDSGTKNLASSVGGSTLIIIAVIIVLISAFYKKRKGQAGAQTWRRLGFILGVAMILTVFATSDKMTPTKVVGSVSNLAQSAVGSLTTGLTPDFGGSKDSMSSFYIDNMHKAYLADGKANAQVDQISRLWEQSGLQAYKRVQFGGSNFIADDVYAPWLDLISGTPAEEIKQHAGFTQNDVKWDSPAMLNNRLDQGDSTLTDQAIFAWAACASSDGGSSWYVRDVFRPSEGKSFKTMQENGKEGEECWKMFNKTAGNYGDVFDNGKPADNVKKWLEGVDDVNAVRADSLNMSNLDKGTAIINFSDAVHGADAGSGTMESITALVVALVCFIVFGVIFGGIIIFIKVMIMIMTAVLVIAMVVSIFTQNGPTMLARYGKQFFGYQFFAAGSSAILAVVLWMTGMVSFAINGLLAGMGSNLLTSFIAMQVPAWAPILSMVGLHQVFTKLLKMPSPFTLGGAKAWSTVGAGAGPMVGSGIGSWLGNKAANGAKRAGSAVASKATGGRLGGAGSAGNGPKKLKDAAPVAGAKGAPQAADLSKKHSKQLGKAGIDAGEAAAALAWSKANKDKLPVSAGSKLRKAIAESNAAHPLAALDAQRRTRQRFLAGTGPTMGQRLAALGGSDEARLSLAAAKQQRSDAMRQLNAHKADHADTPIRDQVRSISSAALESAKSSVSTAIAQVRENPWQAAATVGKVAAVTAVGAATGGAGIAALAGGAYLARRTVKQAGANRRVAQAKSAMDMYEQHSKSAWGKAPAAAERAQSSRPVDNTQGA
ncbi:hypothetical protein F8O07_06930 [Pseudoclavibacter sp. CFCC 13796]|nr:hypothetical protein F8O07_06930 [Pseudoclavibacter sp. CFCC 13796]